MQAEPGGLDCARADPAAAHHLPQCCIGSCDAVMHLSMCPVAAGVSSGCKRAHVIQVLGPVSAGSHPLGATRQGPVRMSFPLLGMQAHADR